VNKEDLAVDQAMVVWQGCPTSRRYDGRVAKIARKYVTIEIWRGPNSTSEIEFDIETQKERGNTSHYAAVFRTPEQQAHRDRQRAAHSTAPYDGPVREWTELRLDYAELMALLSMPEGTRLISMRADTINGAVVITVEQPLEA
jgi:hypothetical protein